MKRLRKVAGILAVGMLLVSLTGCGNSSGKGYVKSVLDVAYDKDVKNYAKIMDIKKDEAQKYMDQSIQSEAEIMTQYFGFDVSDEAATTEFKGLCKKMYDKAKYTVKSATGDNVTVEIEPLNVFQQAKKDVAAYLEEYNVAAYANNDEKATPKEAAKKISEICEKYLDKPEYGDKVTVDIEVYKKQGKWFVSDDSLNKVDKQIICYVQPAK